MGEEPPLRDAILKVITANPGIHFREIQRRTGAAVGQVEYHLYQLEKMEKIHSREDGKIRRYFTTDGTGMKQRRIIYFLRNPVGRDIIYLMIQKGRVSENIILKGRKSLRSIKENIISDMLKEGIIKKTDEGGEVSYELSDQEMVKSTIMQFRESFLDTLTSNIISILDSS